ncbi:MAG: hypothetical protein KDN22_02900 [Verrucomicrobiae bacterium]|nr:hypothetical protein [Verrucomicrobiae bacterium]
MKAAIFYPNDIADWSQAGSDKDQLPEERIGWRGTWGNGTGERVLSEVIWRNPHSDKTIRSIDFVSELKAAAPFLVGITLE